jgi:hypothetical protein
MKISKSLKIVILSVSLLAVGTFLIGEVSRGSAHAGSVFVSCKAQCNGGMKLKSGVARKSIFPVCYCEGKQNSIMLELDAEQLKSFEKLHAYFKAEQVDPSLIHSLEIIRKAALANNNELYSAEVKEFDIQWEKLPRDFKEEIKAALSL